MFLEIYKNIYLQDSSIYKTISIIKKYFISDSRVIFWDDKSYTPYLHGIAWEFVLCDDSKIMYININCL